MLHNHNKTVAKKVHGLQTMRSISYIHSTDYFVWYESSNFSLHFLIYNFFYTLFEALMKLNFYEKRNMYSYQFVILKFFNFFYCSNYLNYVFWKVKIYKYINIIYYLLNIYLILFIYKIYKCFKLWFYIFIKYK